MKPFIYALIDPLEPMHVRYIGMTTSSERRPLSHLKEARCKKACDRWVLKWVRRLLAAGRRYKVLVLEEFAEGTPLSDVCDAECDFIACALADGHLLTNLTPGGDCYKLSETQKAKLSIAQRKRFENPEEREKIRRGHLGKKSPEGTGEKIRAAQIASWASGKRKIVSPSNKGKKATQELRNRLSQAVKEHWKTRTRKPTETKEARAARYNGYRYKKQLQELERSIVRMKQELETQS